MDEPTCDILLRGGAGPCGQPAAIQIQRFWYCPKHVQTAPGHHLLSDATLLAIIGECVQASEAECRAGHSWKADEVTLGLHRQLLRRLARLEHGAAEETP